MKKVIFSMVILTAVILSSCKKENETVTIDKIEVNKQSLTDVQFGVRGNCGMCKSNIENAALKVNGVKNANWNVKEKTIKVTFNKDKTNINDIEKAVAAVGYDTSNFKGDDFAYKSNAKCCQYDRAMEIK